ncbi:glycosyltransferase family 2 protein [Formosa maritima]|uniref:Glycosyltransferase n=1 Tax=Formosa maritima TaxID=2592046 RepID=A0A5D0GG72_9FLAO|nr:glycosyltransferase [Formosa maritima]TYA56642.1 glycosyltransferase [Formosa maritima]
MIIKPLVSISVVTYNHVNYIKKCLDGILMQQTTFPFEVIIGEDESTDGTRDICKSYAEKYPDKINLFLRSREDVINIKGNATGRFNMIENLKACRGKYIALCEGDDYWTEPLKLQKQVDFLEANQDVNVCFHRVNVLRDNKLSLHEMPEPFNIRPFKYIELLKHYNFIATASVIFRKPQDLEFPAWFTKLPFGDLGLYKLVSKNYKIQCLDEVMCVYRVHDKGIYSGLETLKALQIYLNFYKVIFPVLNLEEKEIVRIKIREVTYKISKLKFPKTPLLKKLYNRYLRFKSVK